MKPLSRARFTLVELLTVIVIIAILAAMLLPAFAKMREKTTENASVARMRQVEALAQAFKTETGQFPLVKDNVAWDRDDNFDKDKAAVINNRGLARALEVNGYISPAADSLLSTTYVPKHDAPTHIKVKAKTDSLADRMFIDAWGRPLVYIHLSMDATKFDSGWGLTDEKPSLAGLKRMKEPLKAFSPHDKDNERAKDNAYGRGSAAEAFAPSWPGMADDDTSTAAKQRRRQLSEYFELWSAGADGRFTFASSGVSADARTESFHDRSVQLDGKKVNQDNVSATKPWDGTELMPWEK